MFSQKAKAWNGKKFFPGFFCILVNGTEFKKKNFFLSLNHRKNIKIYFTRNSFFADGNFRSVVTEFRIIDTTRSR